MHKSMAHQRFLDLSRSGIESKRITIARQLSNMFPQDRQVYAYFEGDSAELFSIIEFNERLKGLSPEQRRVFLSRTYELRNMPHEFDTCSRIWFEEYYPKKQLKSTA